MRSTAKLLFAPLLIAGAVFAQGGPPGFRGPGFRGPGFGGPGGPGGQPVTGAPYSAIRTETHKETLTDGNTIQQTRTEKVYRDTDGRMRTESTVTTPSGATKTMIVIVDPVAGFVARLDAADSTASKMTLPSPPLGSMKGPHRPPADANTPHVEKNDLGAKTVSGVEATGTLTKVTIPAGAMGNTAPLVETREVWISTALKIPVMATASDPRRGDSNMVMSNIVAGAQDPALFQIPSGYAVKDAAAHRGPGGRGPDAGGPPPPPQDGGSL